MVQFLIFLASQSFQVRLCVLRDFTYSGSGRSIPPMSSIFKKELNHHWILFSLHKEIIEDSYSLWFPRKGTPIVILHTLPPTEATFESDVSK